MRITGACRNGSPVSGDSCKSSSVGVAQSTSMSTSCTAKLVESFAAMSAVAASVRPAPGPVRAGGLVAHRLLVSVVGSLGCRRLSGMNDKSVRHRTRPERCGDGERRADGVRRAGWQDQRGVEGSRGSRVPAGRRRVVEQGRPERPSDSRVRVQLYQIRPSTVLVSALHTGYSLASLRTL